jgi:hypothetical protein
VIGAVGMALGMAGWRCSLMGARLRGCVWQLGKSGGRERECARRLDPHKGMHDADARMDHKAILNLCWKCSKTNGFEAQGLFASTVGSCPLSMQIILHGLGPIPETIGCSLRGENNLS